ncbi:MAG: mechanosensitive ion channel [Xenococcus sp. MO_188.B8]|nr:mechanosensitive ion channel [Xenococcus sp. MO_188.B8]
MITRWLGNIFTTPLFYLGSQSISLLWILKILGLLIFVSILARIIKRLLKYRILLSLGISDSNREAISTLISFTLAALGYFIVIQTMGINLASLAVVIGGLGVGIGFGFQDLTRNLISGLTILGERKLKAGDLIEFHDQLGYIREISIRSTVIQTLQGSELIIPNTELTNSVVVNWNYDNCQGRINLEVGVAYGSDLLVVTDILLNSAMMVKEVLDLPAPQVIFSGFGDNALNFVLWAWIDRMDRALIIKSSLLYTIEYNLRQNNITIPFPQRDIWIHHPDSSNKPSLTSELSSSISKNNKPSLNSSLRELLLEFSLFKNFNDLQLLNLIKISNQRYLKAGEILIRQGEYGGFFALILVGEVEAIFQANTTERSFFLFTSGEYFGELPLLLNIPYPTTMKATKNTRLLLINSENFHDLLQEYPFLVEQISQELASRQDRIEISQKQLEEMGLLKKEEINNPILWIRKYFQQFFQ